MWSNCIVLPSHSLCSLSGNGSTAPSKVSSPESVMQCLLFQMCLCHWQLHIYLIIYWIVNLYINFRKAQVAGSWTIKARDARRITAAEMKYMRRTTGYTWTDHKTNTQIAKELKITPILDKLQEYKRNWIHHVNRMPLHRLPRAMKQYSPTGRRNHGRPLKRLLDAWDQNGSTSGPTPWKIDDDDDDK